eukprot:1317442-Lingulodinium_polyedra.AAC.1
MAAVCSSVLVRFALDRAALFALGEALLEAAAAAEGALKHGCLRFAMPLVRAQVEGWQGRVFLQAD